MMTQDKPIEEHAQSIRYSKKNEFVWSEDPTEFVSSGGALIRAILFRAMIDSVDKNEGVRNEARDWLTDNFKSFWNLIFGNGVDKMWDFLLDLWSNEAEMTHAQAKAAISYSMNKTNIVDPEGESRFDPYKNRRRS